MAEANHHIHTGSARSFSAQELLDCTPNPRQCGGSGGCGGATVELAMYHMMQKGCATQADTPYRAFDQTCTNPSTAVSLVQGVGVGADEGSLSLSVEDLTQPDKLQKPLQQATDSVGLQYWKRLPKNQDHPLQLALLQGTVAVSVAASEWAGYWHGIFNSCKMDAVIDHAVMAIGFGKESTKDGENKYWTIQNSWGSSWGEEGKIRLLRTDSEYCGMDRRPEDGTGCKGGPEEVKVCGMCGILYDSVFAQFR